MPQLGETVTEGTITRWMKKIGDAVERDEPLFEVSTDKVDSEVPSPAAGVVTEILVKEGDTVAVGARLAVIGDSGAPPAPAPPVVETPPVAVAPPPVAPPPPPAPAPVVTAPEPVPVASAPTPPPPPPGFVPVANAATANGSASDPRVLSPVVRRLLDENKIAASEVKGTGVGGRITREDVLAVIDTRRSNGAPAPVAAAPAPAPVAAAPAPAPQAAAPAPAPAPQVAPPPAFVAPQAAPAAPVVQSVFPSADDSLVPFNNMRRRTAEHMVRSKATSPHAFIAYEADFENVERVRAAIGRKFKEEEGFSLTYLPFIAKATVEALGQFPNLNASVGDQSLVVHRQINLGIAVDLNHDGLIVPVVARAEEMNVRGIARRIRDLADRARNKALSADDIAGGTFTITNDGPFGTYFTVPIINQPQVAIMATDGIKRRPVVVTSPDGSESIAIHSTGLIGLSWDHRAVDGAYVSSFLAAVAEILATRNWLADF